VLESSLLTAALMAVALEDDAGFDGTATELLELIQHHPGAGEKGWPRTANTLSGKLRALAPALRDVGMVVEDREVRGRKHWSLSAKADAASELRETVDAAGLPPTF